jgi:hypothetical protein
VTIYRTYGTNRLCTMFSRVIGNDGKCAVAYHDDPNWLVRVPFGSLMAVPAGYDTTSVPPENRPHSYGALMSPGERRP